jgi:hypothetical protein
MDGHGRAVTGLAKRGWHHLTRAAERHVKRSLVPLPGLFPPVISPELPAGIAAYFRQTLFSSLPSPDVTFYR